MSRLTPGAIEILFLFLLQEGLGAPSITLDTELFLPSMSVIGRPRIPISVSPKLFPVQIAAVTDNLKAVGLSVRQSMAVVIISRALIALFSTASRGVA